MGTRSTFGLNIKKKEQNRKFQETAGISGNSQYKKKNRKRKKRVNLCI